MPLSAKPAALLFSRHFRCLLLVTTALASLAGTALAEDWTGTNSDDWADGGNWTGGTVPTGTSTVNIDGTARVEAMMAQPDMLNVGSSAPGTLNIINGSVFEAVTSTSVGLGGGGVGVVNVDGSDFTTGALFVGYFGRGTLNFSNGATGTSNVSYLGYQFGSHGVVSVSGPGSSWTVSAGLILGYQGDAELHISDGGTVLTDTAYLAADAGSTGTLTVDGNGSSFTSTGDLLIGQFGLGYLSITNGASVSNVDGYLGYAVGYANSAVVDGTGSSWTNSGSLTIGNGPNSFGDLTISGGGTVSAVDITLGGSSDAFGQVLVTGAGSLLAATDFLNVGDHGTGRLSILDGARVTAGGDVYFDSSSTYKVGVGSGTSADPLHVAGDATFNGSAVEVVATSGGYTPGIAYTIVTADGGVNDTFASVSSNFAFLTPQLSYDATHAFVTLITNGVDFADVAATPNQAATADGLDALGVGNGLYDTVAPLSSADAQAAFDAMSGEVHASLKADIIDNGGLLRDAVLGRLRQSHEGLGDTIAAVSNYAGGPLADNGLAADRGLWGTASGAFRHADGDGNAAATDSSSAGLVLGADGLVSDWRLGFVAGAGKSHLAIPQRASGADIDDYGLGVYAGTDWNATRLALGAGLARHAISTSRDVALPGLTETLTADYGATSGQIFGEVSHVFDFGALELEPYGQATHRRQWTDGFTESGGIAALTSTGDVIDQTFTTLGLRASYDIALGETLAKASLGLGWRHVFGETAQNTAHFIGGTDFTVSAAPIARDAVVLDAGLTVDLNAQTGLSLSYDGQLADGESRQALRASLVGKF